MLFANVVFNIFTAVVMLRIVFNVFSVMFAKNVAVAFLCLYLIFFTNQVCVVPYSVIRNFNAIIRVSNYVLLNPGLQRVRPLWSGASDELITQFFLWKENLCYFR